MNPTAYELLGVAPNASAEDIEAAYRTQAAEVDPALLKERATGATAFRYKMLTEAYARLSEPERRLAYDLGLRYPPGALPVPPKPKVAARWCTPLVASTVIGALLVGTSLWGVHLYKVREAEREEQAAVAARIEQARLESAERESERVALAEQRRIRQETLSADHRQKIEMEQARYEGQFVHDSVARAEREAAEREVRMLAEQERRARYEQQREQALAQQRRYMEQRDAERRLKEFERGPVVTVIPPPKRMLSDAR